MRALRGRDAQDEGAYAKYKEQGVEFIGVSLDNPAAGLKSSRTLWPRTRSIGRSISWARLDSEFSQSWGINSIPCVFIVDAGGNLYSTEARGKLDQLVPELLKKRDG